MKITTRGRYGLRAMVALAESYGRGPKSLSELAKRQGQSRKYLHTLLTLLKQGQLVATTKGRHGGYMLARPPDEITLRDMLHALEGPFDSLDCFDDIRKIKNPKNCRVRRTWKHVTDELDKLLQTIALSDMADENCRFVPPHRNTP